MSTNPVPSSLVRPDGTTVYRYETNVYRNGERLNRETYVDWYCTDQEAIDDSWAAFRVYNVERVEMIGRVTSIYLK